MNKTWTLIGLASLIIVGVMVYLTIQGVAHREHTFIKWSPVDKPGEMGIVSMRRLYPLLREKKNLVVVSNSGIIADFIAGFDRGVQEHKVDLKVTGQSETPEPSDDMIIKILPLATDVKPGSCAEVSKEECIYFKAQRAWHKKKRDPSRYWFLLQWVAKNNFHLYFTKP